MSLHFGGRCASVALHRGWRIVSAQIVAVVMAIITVLISLTSRSQTIPKLCSSALLPSAFRRGCCLFFLHFFPPQISDILSFFNS